MTGTGTQTWTTGVTTIALLVLRTGELKTIKILFCLEIMGLINQETVLVRSRNVPVENRNHRIFSKLVSFYTCLCCHFEAQTSHPKDLALHFSPFWDKQNLLSFAGLYSFTGFYSYYIQSLSSFFSTTLDGSRCYFVDKMLFFTFMRFGIKTLIAALHCVLSLKVPYIWYGYSLNVPH